MSKTLKVGVIGVGGIAGAHFPGWKESPDAEMIAFADVNPAALSRAADAHGITRRYESAAELIADPDIDIVDICTPNMYHTDAAIAALEAGKHVLCEKPLAPTPADIRRMIEARDKSGKLLMTAQHFRFSASAKSLKQQIDKGVLGDVYHARSWMLRRAGMIAGPGFIYKRNSGGGPVIDIGVHILDLTLWMMGCPKAVSVTGVTQDKLSKKPGAFTVWGSPSIPPDMDVEEFAAAFVRLENGATLILEVSWLLHHETPGEDMQMWLYGDKGGAHWPQNELLSTDYQNRQWLKTVLQRNDGMEAHALECVAFADAVASGKPSPVPAEESLNVITILDGLYRSAAEQREVRL